jgi:hypothetical protein
VVICGVTSPISIGIDPELKGRMLREVNSMKQSPIDIAQNMENKNIMYRERHKLTNQMT